jgi:hypothetical protein
MTFATRYRAAREAARLSRRLVCDQCTTSSGARLAESELQRVEAGERDPLEPLCSLMAAIGGRVEIVWPPPGPRVIRRPLSALIELLGEGCLSLSEAPPDTYTPAHAETHRRIMAALEAMTPEEIFQHAVTVGICRPDGTLTEEYGGLPREEKL